MPKITEEKKKGKKKKNKVDNEKKVEIDYNSFPKEKSHWEKYQLYYLVFGSFFVTIVIILISNSSINNQIRKINKRLSGEIYSSYLSPDLNFSSKITEYLSRLKNESFPDYVKERVA